MDFPILNYVRLDDKTITQLHSLSKKEQRTIEQLKSGYFRGHTFRVEKQNPVVKLAIVLKAAEKTLKLYQKLNIGESIFRATFDDLRIWCENYKKRGWQYIGWLKNHVTGKLFKIGRLQYQIFTYKISNKKARNLPFSTGEKLIYVHIPQGEKLDIHACRESLRMANGFFRTYFPKYDYKYYFCESWLLYEGNRKFMKEDSNILQFMNLFDIHSSVELEEQALERIFHANEKSYPAFFGKDLAARQNTVRLLPENTSLQRATKQYLLDGNKLGIGIGTIAHETSQIAPPYHKFFHHKKRVDNITKLFFQSR